jgi:hypothetical protein
MPQVVSATDLVRGVFAALDAKDPVAVTDRMTDDVRMRLGNAGVVEGKARFLEATAAFLTSIEAIRHEITSMWTFHDVVVAEMDAAKVPTAAGRRSNSHDARPGRGLSDEPSERTAA